MYEHLRDVKQTIFLVNEWNVASTLGLATWCRELKRILCKRQQSSTGCGAPFLVAVPDSASRLDSISRENEQEMVEIWHLCQLRDRACFCAWRVYAQPPPILNMEDRSPEASAAVKADIGNITGQFRTEAEFRWPVKGASSPAPTPEKSVSWKT